MRNWFLAIAALGPIALAQPFDLVLAGGRIVDGMGNPWYRADLGIRAGKIAAIGHLKGLAATRVVDVHNQMIAPGFIDMMGASSTPLLLDPASSISKLSQGVTTIMAGEGNSEAPQNHRIFPGDAAAAGYHWTTFAEYFRLLDKRGVAINVIHNVGAAQVRRVVMGDEDRAPSPAELARMKDLVAQAMREGAIGISSALIYPPGVYAKTSELIELAKAAAPFGGIYSTHMRNESFEVLNAVREAIAIGESAGVPVHIYHLKAAGQDNWPLMEKAIDLIRQARARGLDITADIYPYTRNGLGLTSFIHPRHFAQGAKPLLDSLKDPKVRAALRREIESTSDWENWYRHAGNNWDNVLVAEMASHREYEGKSIAQIAALRRADPWTTFFDLVGMGPVTVNPLSMDENQKRLALRAEFISFCNDQPPADPATVTNVHPRAFGSFPRVLGKYVRQEHVISLEVAVRKMTSLAANALELYDRGRIAPGMAADLVVFDPETVGDRATYQRPLELSAGIHYVLVNGVIEMENNVWTHALAGSVLRHQPLR